VFPQVKIQRIQIWRTWRPCSGPSSTYPSAMILRTSRTVRLKCAGAPSCMYCILSAITYKLMSADTCWCGHFFLFWCVKLVPRVYPQLSVTPCIGISPGVSIHVLGYCCTDRFSPYYFFLILKLMTTFGNEPGSSETLV
jgi:hypothetical protein